MRVRPREPHDGADDRLRNGAVEHDRRVVRADRRSKRGDEHDGCDGCA
jgi:hypothetical protein